MMEIKNYKFILLIYPIIISIIIGIGLGFFIITRNSDDEGSYNQVLYDNNIYFKYGVRSYNDTCGCNIPLRIFVFPLGNEVIFNQNLSFYCSPPITDSKYFTIEVNLSSNNLMIREIFDPKGMPVSRCVCPYKINGRISNIPIGVYKLSFIEENRFVNQTRILQTFDITL